MFVKIFINDNLVAETRIQNINWPYFESTFMEKF